MGKGTSCKCWRNRFDGQVAAVTGAGRGIGRATALALAGQGAAVAVLARSGDEIAATAAAIEADQGRALAVRVGHHRTRAVVWRASLRWPA